MHFSHALIAAVAALPVAFASPIATASVEISTKRDEFDQCHYGFFTNDKNVIQCISPSGQDSASKRDHPEKAALCPAGWFVFEGAVHCIPSPELDSGGPTPSPAPVKRSNDDQSIDSSTEKRETQNIEMCESAGCIWVGGFHGDVLAGCVCSYANKPTGDVVEKRQTQQIEACENAGCMWTGSPIDFVFGQCICPQATSSTGDIVEKRQTQQIEACENAGCMWTGSPIDFVFGQCICPQATSSTGDIVEKRQTQQIEACENAGCMWTGSPIDFVFGQCICPQAKGPTGDKRSIDPSHAWLARNSPTNNRKRSDDTLPPTWIPGPFGPLYIRDDSASDGGNNWLPPSPTATTTKRDLAPEQYGKSWMCSVQGLDYDPYVVDVDNPYGSCVVFVDPSTIGGRDKLKAKRSSDDVFHQSTCYSGDFCASIGYHWRDIGGGCSECF